MKTHFLANRKVTTLVGKVFVFCYSFSGPWSRLLAWLVLSISRVSVLWERIWDLGDWARFQSRFLLAVWPWPVIVSALPTTLSCCEVYLRLWEPKSWTNHIITAFIPIWHAVYLYPLSVFSHWNVSYTHARFCWFCSCCSHCSTHGKAWHLVECNVHFVWLLILLLKRSIKLCVWFSKLKGICTFLLEQEEISKTCCPWKYCLMICHLGKFPSLFCL